MSGDTVGATSKATPEMVQAIIELLEAGNTRSTAASIAGIGRTTFYRWLEDEDGAFRHIVENAESVAQQNLLATIRKASLAGPNSWQAAAWMLERRWYAEYGRRDTSKVEVTLDIRKTAERLAEQAGLSVDEVMAEAERIMAGAEA